MKQKRKVLSTSKEEYSRRRSESGVWSGDLRVLNASDETERETEFFMRGKKWREKIWGRVKRELCCNGRVKVIRKEKDLVLKAFSSQLLCGVYDAWLLGVREATGIEKVQ